MVSIYRGKGVQHGLVGGGVDGGKSQIDHLAVDLRRSLLLGTPLSGRMIGKVDEHRAFLLDIAKRKSPWNADS